MRDVQTDRRPGESRVVGRPQAACLGHSPADPLAEPVAITFLRPGVEKNVFGEVPDRPARLRDLRSPRCRESRVADSPQVERIDLDLAFRVGPRPGSRTWISGSDNGQDHASDRRAHDRRGACGGE